MSQISFLKSPRASFSSTLLGICLAAAGFVPSLTYAVDVSLATFTWSRDQAQPQADNVYHLDDTLSAKFTNATVPGVQAAMTGRHYGILAHDSMSMVSFRWGLLGNYADDGSLRPGWTVSFGFEPDDYGVTTHTATTGGIWDASYLSFVFTPSASQSLAVDTITLTKPEFLLVDDKAWAAVSTNEFKTPVRLLETVDPFSGETKISASFNGTTAAPGQSVEVRVYGLLGEDEGYFDVAQAQTRVFGSISAVAVPEPTVTGALALGLAALWRRRR